MRIACVQTQARNIDEAELSLREALEAIDRAAERRPDLVLLPEVARVLALQGADLVVWPVSSASSELELLARTRASESRIFLAVANSIGNGRGESMIVSPGGAILAQAFPDRAQGIAAPCCLASARVKSVVPGTDLVADRCPDDYGILVARDTEWTGRELPSRPADCGGSDF